MVAAKESKVEKPQAGVTVELRVDTMVKMNKQVNTEKE